MTTDHWTRNRQELLDWLRKTSPSLAELYEGAVILLFSERVPGFSRFVSHAVREIRNRLPGVISGTASSGRLDYKSRIDDLGLHWKRAGVSADAKPSEDENRVDLAVLVSVPRKIARKIESLIADHDAARQRPQEAAMKLFEGIAPSNQQFRDRLRPVIVQWIQVCDWFMERTHESGFTDADVDLPEFKKNFELFESTLLAIVRGVSTFFDNTNELDAIIKESPTPERVEAAIARMGHGEFHRYFFDKLERPDWIRPLREKRFFTSPPAPVRNEAEGTIGFAVWPESRFLLRMAKLNPEAVAETVLQVPETENTRVHDDLADIAIALPPALAAKLVPQAKGWIRTPYGVVLPQKMGTLIAKLAEGGEVAAALDLTGALLEVLPDPKPVLVPEPVGHIDVWHYERILRKDVGMLISIAGLPALELLADRLSDALRLSQKEPDENDFDDYSFVWRPTVEYGRGFARGVADPLTSAVVEGAIRLIADNQVPVSDVVNALEARKWTLLQRIALHVLRVFADRTPDLVAERLKLPSRYDHSGTAREFWSVAQSQFKTLSEDAKSELLTWIDRGPNLEAYARRMQEFTGQPVTEAQAVVYGKAWRRDRLEVLKEGLPEKWKQEYERLVAELGPANDITEARGVTPSGFAQIGPKNVADLQQMPIDEIVAYLRSWQPKAPAEPVPFGGERIADLAANLGAAVAADPGRFATAAQQFKDLDPTYVREFLQALREPARKAGAFDWREVIALCQWAVNQPRVIPGRTGGLFDRDTGWAWTRAAIVRLFASGFESDSLPVELRTEAWGILRELTEDPDPTAEDEAKFLSQQNSDPHSLSINTIRGEAMHALVQYALWVRRGFEKAPNRDALVSRGFEEMPEVREALDRHLDPAVDSSLTSRSVYGRWLPWLHFLDRRWMETNLPVIFPVDNNLRTLRDCAWTTYIVLCEPYNNVYRSLATQYLEATERIGTYKIGKSHLGDPDNHLAQHLLTLYWRGIVPGPLEAGPLRQFYANAPDKLRGNATSFIGRTLKNDTGNIPSDIMERLQNLWEARVTSAKDAADASSFQKELTEFGWWFVSQKSTDEWSIQQLLGVLKITKKIDPDLWVVERLAELSVNMPLETVQCLDLILEGDEKGWGVMGWKDDARKVLATVLASGDAAARALAQRVVHKLGGRGYFEFRALLDEPYAQ